MRSLIQHHRIAVRLTFVVFPTLMLATSSPALAKPLPEILQSARNDLIYVEVFDGTDGASTTAAADKTAAGAPAGTEPNYRTIFNVRPKDEYRPPANTAAVAEPGKSSSSDQLTVCLLNGGEAQRVKGFDYRRVLLPDYRSAPG